MPRRVCWGCEAWSMTWRRSCARLWIRRWGRSRLARGAWSRAFSAKSSYFLLSRLASWWASANGQASTFCPHTLSLYLRSSWSYSYILISYWATKGERLKLGSLVGPDHGLRHPAGAQHPLLLRPQVQHHILQISVVHLRLSLNTSSMRIPHCLFQVLSSKAALPRLRIRNLSWRGCSCHPPLFHQVLTFTFTFTLTFTLLLPPTIISPGSYFHQSWHTAFSLLEILMCMSSQEPLRFWESVRLGSSAGDHSGSVCANHRLHVHHSAPHCGVLPNQYKVSQYLEVGILLDF